MQRVHGILNMCVRMYNYIDWHQMQHCGALSIGAHRCITDKAWQFR